VKGGLDNRLKGLGLDMDVHISLHDTGHLSCPKYADYPEL